MTEIVPAVLADSADNYKFQAEKFFGFINRIHIDITDGEFAPSFTVGAAQIWWPEEWRADIHAMVARPSDHVETLASLKPNLVIFHAEVQEEVIPTLQYLKQMGIKAGLALLKTTVPSLVADAIKEADHVLIFSGDLGHYGGKASMMQIEKVRLIEAINPAVEIGWDGGANLENVYNLAQAGIDVINVGGALANTANTDETYNQLVSEANKQGVI